MLRWKVRPVAKAVAYVIRAHSDKEGRAVMNADQLKRETNATWESISSGIVELRNAGALEVTEGKTQWEPTKYRLHQSPTVYTKSQKSRKQPTPKKKKGTLPPEPPSTWPDVVGAKR
jgi:hypothetical protein